MSDSREQIRQLLTSAVEDGLLSFAEAEDLLAAFDAGIYTADEIRAKIEKRDRRGLLLLITALAVLLHTEVRWKWDRERQVYIDPEGNPEPPAFVRRAVDRMIEARGSAAARANEDIEPAAGRPIEPGPRVPELPPPRLVPPANFEARMRLWRENMERWIAERHIAAGAAGRGGFDQLTGADKDWIRQRILDQYQYLDRFEAEIRARWAAGNPFSLDYLNARARLYFEAARGTYEEMSRRSHREAGFHRERNVLGVAEHCDVCLGEFRKGWVPIGTLIPIGMRTCLSQCRCRIEYRRIAMAPGARRRRREAAA